MPGSGPGLARRSWASSPPAARPARAWLDAIASVLAHVRQQHDGRGADCPVAPPAGHRRVHEGSRRDCHPRPRHPGPGAAFGRLGAIRRYRRRAPPTSLEHAAPCPDGLHRPDSHAQGPGRDPMTSREPPRWLTDVRPAGGHVRALPTDGERVARLAAVSGACLPAPSRPTPCGSSTAGTGSRLPFCWAAGGWSTAGRNARRPAARCVCAPPGPRLAADPRPTASCRGGLAATALGRVRPPHHRPRQGSHATVGTAPYQHASWCILQVVSSRRLRRDGKQFTASHDDRALGFWPPLAPRQQTSVTRTPPGRRLHTHHRPGGDFRAMPIRAGRAMPLWSDRGLGTI